MHIASRTGKPSRHQQHPPDRPTRRRSPRHAPGRPGDDEEVKLPARAPSRGDDRADPEKPAGMARAPAREFPIRSNAMDLDSDMISARWTQIPDRLQRRWRKLTADDVRYPHGSARYLATVLQDRYGIDRREAMLQVYEFESELW